jgi:glycosyltransferase involved in cell wall biosynthesis
VRLGVYSDLVYRRDGATLSNNRAFIRFVTSLPPLVDEVVLFGRLDPKPGRSPYELPAEGVRLVPLPFYPRVTSVVGVVRAARRSCAIFAAELDRLDAVWIFGPHPLALAFAVIARRRGVPLFLGVRQDYPQYIAGRLPGRGWRWAVPAARLLDEGFRLLARRAPTVALGAELAERYAGGDAPVLTTGFSLVRAHELRPLDDALAAPWNGDLRLLAVGRLDPEKNPLLLPDVIAAARRRDPRWRLIVAGDGPLRGALERRIAELGLGDAVELHGEVANGPELWTLYRSCHAFLHVSLTEGLPQVLFEAQAAGLPVVATAVGGVPAAVGDAGLLVPPADAAAAAAAVGRLAADPQLRRRLIGSGLRKASEETLEAQLERHASFFAEGLAAAQPAASSSTAARLSATDPAAPASAIKSQK